MRITKDNLNQVQFENHDARLLIQDVVTHTTANLYYYYDSEITVKKAIDIWNRAYRADAETQQFSFSFLTPKNIRSIDLIVV